MTVPAGLPFEVKVRCANTGNAVWLGPDAYQYVGSVRLGPHLYDANMRLIEFELTRQTLQKVLPGERLETGVWIGPLPAGNYILTIDLVAEFVAWFELVGAVPPRLELTVV